MFGKLHRVPGESGLLTRPFLALICKRINKDQTKNIRPAYKGGNWHVELHNVQLRRPILVFIANVLSIVVKNIVFLSLMIFLKYG